MKLNGRRLLLITLWGLVFVVLILMKVYQGQDQTLALCILPAFCVTPYVYFLIRFFSKEMRRTSTPRR